MAIELLEQIIPAIGAIKEYSGSTTFNMDSEKILIIETSPRGDDILDIEVPSGKKWKVSLKLHITETDL